METRIVRRHLLDARGRLGNALDRGLDTVAGCVLHRAKADLVLQCIDQLDVADRAGQLANQSRNALIAFAANAHRPR